MVLATGAGGEAEHGGFTMASRPKLTRASE